jgi:hypothetical protein
MQEYENKIAEISNLTVEINKQKNSIARINNEYDKINGELIDVKGYSNILEENIKIIETENTEIKDK